MVYLVNQYTLPVTQSSGISCRAPSNRQFNFYSWHMPDFGGVVDIKDIALKNNSLGRSPYKPNHVALPLYIDTKNTFPETGLHRGPITSNNLSILKDRNNAGKISLCKAYRNVISFSNQSLDEYYPTIGHWHNYDPTHDKNDIWKQSFDQDILSLDFNTESEIFIVNFKNESILINANRSQTENAHKFSLKNLTTIKFNSEQENDETTFRSCCFNPFMPELLTYAVENTEQWQLRQYDINSKNSLPTAKYSCDSSKYLSEVCIGDRAIGRTKYKTRVYRMMQNRERVQSVSPVPNHLVNMLLTTDNRVGICDPRCYDMDISMMVEKSKLSTLYPLENFKGSKFSILDENQFYTLSDSHLRVFDLRYHNTVLNQLGHMLKIEEISSFVSEKFIHPNWGNTEVVLINDGERVCMSTFRKHATEPLINPVSCSPPFTISKPMDSFFNLHGTQLSSIQDKIVNNLVTGIQIIKLEDVPQLDDLSPVFDTIQLVGNGGIFCQRFYDFEPREDAGSDENNSPYKGGRVADFNPYPVPTEYVNKMRHISSKLTNFDLREIEENLKGTNDFDLVDDNGDILEMEVELDVKSSLHPITDHPQTQTNPTTNTSCLEESILNVIPPDLEEDFELPVIDKCNLDEQLSERARQKLEEFEWTY